VLPALVFVQQLKADIDLVGQLLLCPMALLAQQLEPSAEFFAVLFFFLGRFE
jgi:hypothetical protein